MVMDVSPVVDIRKVSRRFGAFTAVDEVTLQIQRGEFFSLLGPSGCGKTTLLRMMAGFDEPDEGSIHIQGRDVTREPPHRRPTHMVFQQYALFPHLTVGENVAFGLRYKKIPKDEHEGRVARALEMVRLPGSEKKLPSQLSGGQRQRVALARALILEPVVLLLDEPLSALDRKLREEMQGELKELQRKLGITFVFVTHDQEEALSLSDRMVVMNQGRVEQWGSGVEIFEKPRTEFVAGFMGAVNRFKARVIRSDDHSIRVQSSLGFELDLQVRGKAPQIGSEVLFVVRPEKMRIQGSFSNERGIIGLEISVRESHYQGAQTVWVVQHASGDSWRVLSSSSSSPHDFSGGKGFVCWDVSQAVLLENPGSPGR